MRPDRSLRISASFVVLLALHPAAFAGSPDPEAVAEQMKALETGCVGSEAARQARHSETPLYERLGGHDRILDLTREFVRLHKANEDIQQMFARVDDERLAAHVADFMSAGTGGEAEYTGRDLVSAHADLHITDADFLSAGGDIVQAMQNKGYGAEEIDEVVCILVSLKDQVVLE